MPSLIPVTIRHLSSLIGNDNLDGWVTEFVLNLENELKATVKESSKIYFDKNPNDGLSSNTQC